MYNKLDSIQQQYSSSLLNKYRKSDGLSMRLTLGLPKLSDFLMKLKLNMHHKIFKNTNNLFKQLIKKSYIEYYHKYKYNNDELANHLTHDFVMCKPSNDPLLNLRLCGSKISVNLI